VARKISLPVAGPPRPTPVDAARAKLGGRERSDPGAGDLVAFTDDAAQSRLGVTLFVRGDTLFVWTPAGFVRELPRAATQAVDAAIPAELTSIAESARAFAALNEGDRVQYRDATGVGEGTLAEKCRFGALVARDDGSVVAIGFARVGPAGV
jgi:hypothetical protein